jgi:hypothetical protein
MMQSWAIERMVREHRRDLKALSGASEMHGSNRNGIAKGQLSRTDGLAPGPAYAVAPDRATGSRTGR